MRLITIRNLIFLGLAGAIAAIASCSAGSGSGTGTAAAFGLPKVEMKCNGQACIQ